MREFLFSKRLAEILGFIIFGSGAILSFLAVLTLLIGIDFRSDFVARIATTAGSLFFLSIFTALGLWALSRIVRKD